MRVEARLGAQGLDRGGGVAGRAEPLEPGVEQPPTPLGYDGRDTATSLSMGVGNLVVNVGWKLAVAAIYAGAYQLTTLRIPAEASWAWAALLRPRPRLMLCQPRGCVCSGPATSSTTRAGTTTLDGARQTWVPMTAFPFWLPLALAGFKPWMIVLEQSISLTYQFFIHTSRRNSRSRPGC